MKTFPHIYPDFNDWPIKKLADRRKGFIRSLDKETLLKFDHYSTKELRSIIRRSAYQELGRIKNSDWNIDPPNENAFWKKVQKRLEKVKSDDTEQDREELLHIISVIINQYSQEIVGDFKVSTFKFLRRVLTCLFGWLHSKFSLLKPRVMLCSKKELLNKLKMHGDDIEQIRKLAKEGTLIFVPTHSSNIDSILLGYIIDAKVGLPSFSYGAGLNLYNNGFAGFFMNRLGAYRIDRRKRNQIYLETLKTMSELSISQRTDSLFFLGGTRSRNGAIEDKLKLGLLGSTVSAQRRLLQNGDYHKIFVVPLVLSYNFTLEAKSLIEEYLVKTGRDKYSRKRGKTSSFLLALRFIKNLFTKEAAAHLSFGAPIDIMGNRVNEEGKSLDTKGETIDLSLYFKSKGEFAYDPQREQVYTQKLAEVILDSYKKYNIVLASHVVAFAAFTILQDEEETNSEYKIFKYSIKETAIDEKDLIKRIQEIVAKLREMEAMKSIRLEHILREGNRVEDILKFGVQSIGIYHYKKVLFKDRYGSYKTEDTELLFFYHNRLTGYDLE